MISRLAILSALFSASQVATASTLLASFSTDSMDDGFVSTGIPGSWGCGEVTSGPLGGEQGTSACGTGLASNYSNNAADFLRIPSFDLSSAIEPFLAFSQWWNIEVGDEAVVERLLQDGSWESVEIVYGYPAGLNYLSGDGGWVDAWVDLLGIDDTSDLRFSLRSNQGVTGAGWFLDNMEIWEGDIVPPVLQGLSQLTDTDEISQPYSVTVTAIDNKQLELVSLQYALDGGPTQNVVMNDTGSGVFFAQIPAQRPDTQVHYWVEAHDEAHLSVAPDTGMNSFRVRLPAPEGLSGPDEVIHDDSVWLDWVAPVSIQTLYSYGIYRAGEWVLDAYEPFVEVDLHGDGQDSFTVAANYELGTGEIVAGDHSNTWQVDAAVPAIISAEPSVVYQGDTIHLQVVGANMLFVQGDLEITVDYQIEVLAVDVENVDRASITMHIPIDAMTGPRSVYAYSGDSNALLKEAFSVASGDDLPMITEIVPNGLRQGQTGVVEFSLSSPIDSVPLVDLGPGLVIDSVELSTPELVKATVSVDSHAPLGERMAVLDDGVRSITGLHFEVRDQVVDPVGCSSASSRERSGALWLLALCLAALIGRRNALQEGLPPR